MANANKKHDVDALYLDRLKIVIAHSGDDVDCFSHWWGMKCIFCMERSKAASGEWRGYIACWDWKLVWFAFIIDIDIDIG